MAGLAGAVGDFLLAAVAFKKESRSLCLAGNQGFERRIAQYKCFGDERPVRESWLGFFLLPTVSFESRDSVRGFRLYHAVYVLRR